RAAVFECRRLSRRCGRRRRSCSLRNPPWRKNRDEPELIRRHAPLSTVRRRLIFRVALQALDVLAIAVDFGLVAVDLLLLLIVGDLVSLQLIADQSARAQAERAADRRARARMTHRRADNAARRRAAQRADARALLARRQRSPGATREQQRARQKCDARPLRDSLVRKHSVLPFTRWILTDYF